MMYQIIAWWAKNRIAANLLMTGLIIIGFSGISALNREVFPTFAINAVQIGISYPGSQPSDIEKLIVIKVENSMKSLDGVSSIESRIWEGGGSIIVDGANDVDINFFASEIESTVNGISGLPSDMEPLRFNIIQTEDELVILGVSGDTTYQEIQQTAENLQEELLTLNSVNKVEIYGKRDKELSIEVSQFALDEYDLTFDELLFIVRANSLVRSLGTIEDDKGYFKVTVRSLAETVEEFKNITIRELPGGYSLKLADIAKVDWLLVGKVQSLFDQKQAVLLAVQSSHNTDVVEVSEEVIAWLDTLQDKLPRGITVDTMIDQVEPFESRVATILNNAMIGGLLVLIVLVIFLQIRVSFWVSIGILTAYLGTFAILPFTDVSLNMITLFAFLLVLGIIVDDAIIVGENIHARTEQGESGLEAAVNGAMEVHKPVIFAVLTTIIAFTPWFFLSGEEVYVTRQLSLIISIALFISLIESLLILPAHLNNLPAYDASKQNRLGKISSQFNKFVERHYFPLLKKCLKQPLLVVSCFAVFFMLSLVLVSFGYLRSSFTPEIESDLVRVNITYKSGTSFADVQPVTEKLEAIYEHFQSMGDDNPISHYYSSVYSFSTRAFLRLKNENERDMSGKEVGNIVAELLGDIALAETISVSAEFGGSGNVLLVPLLSKNNKQLEAAVRELTQYFYTLEGVRNIRSSLESAITEYKLELLPGTNELGLTLEDVSKQIRQAYLGQEVQRITANADDIRVVVRYPQDHIEDITSLDGLKIRTSSGQRIPLSSIATFSNEQGIGFIRRFDNKRLIRVRAELGDSSLKGNYYEKINEYVEDELLPKYPDVQQSMQGESYETRLFVEEISRFYIIAFFLMYTLLAIAFNSYWYPALILSAVPFAMTGAFLGHLFSDVSISIFSYLGIGAAVGVVINDNLVLIDRYLRCKERMGSIKAILISAKTRFRPIILTSTTTFVSLLGIMNESSVQAQILIPAVVSLAFGILFCVLVTLLMVPCLLIIIHSNAMVIEQWKQGLKQKLRKSFAFSQE